jgi:hypothetical protein
MKRVSIRRRSRKMDGEAWGLRVGCTMARLAAIVQQRRRRSARHAPSTTVPSGTRDDRHSTSSVIPIAPDIPSNQGSWSKVFDAQPRSPLRAPVGCMVLLGCLGTLSTCAGSCQQATAVQMLAASEKRLRPQRMPPSTPPCSEASGDSQSQKRWYVSKTCVPTVMRTDQSGRRRWRCTAHNAITVAATRKPYIHLE